MSPEARPYFEGSTSPHFEGTLYFYSSSKYFEGIFTVAKTIGLHRGKKLTGKSIVRCSTHACYFLSTETHLPTPRVYANCSHVSVRQRQLHDRQVDVRTRVCGLHMAIWKLRMRAVACTTRGTACTDFLLQLLFDR